MEWFTAIKGFVVALLKAIAEYYDFANNKQILDAGKAEAELDVLKRSESDREKARQIKKDIDTLPSNLATSKLRNKYTRD